MIYIHIPFCESKCGYCSFNSFTDSSLVDIYFEKLLIQLKNDLQYIDTIDSIYIGGGTPSSVSYKKYQELFKILPNVKETTVEANPNSGTIDWLKGMKDLGANRISFGVQSFNEQKLKFLTRIHDKNQAIDAIENANKVGFENISLDLMYNTAVDTKKLLENELKIVKNLPISHISAYSLTIEESSNFENRPEKQKIDNDLEFYFVEKLNRLFPQYEISNYGKKSLHNSGYWEYKEYLGVGAGAVGRVGNRRLYPPSSLEEYIEDPLKKTEEVLTEKDIKSEKIFLGLRSFVGIDKALFNPKELEKIQILINEKKLIKKDEKLYNTDYFLADEIAIWIDND